MKSALMDEIKKTALEAGAVMVGFAPSARFKNAPKVYHPESFVPGAKTVIVVGVHYPDACVENCGKDDLQEMGTYGVVQVDMNVLLDMLSFRIARLLDCRGFPAVSFSTSHIWKYRPFGEINKCFTPDFCHRHAAVAAGLGEFGWNGLVLTKDFGPRVRFNSVITTAEFAETPMYEGPVLCDKCMKCVKYCRMDTFRKEVNGMDCIKIADREYKFPNTDRWRCAWAEHFAIGLNVKIPDKIDEKSVLEAKRIHGVYGGEIGNCLRQCLPPHLRKNTSEQTNVSSRLKSSRPEEPAKIIHELEQKILPDVQYIAAIPVGNLSRDLAVREWPPAQSVILAGISLPKDLPDGEVLNHVGGIPRSMEESLAFAKEETRRILGIVGLRVAMIAESHGYDAMPRIDVPHERIATLCGFGGFTGDGRVFKTPEFGANQMFIAIATNAPLPFWTRKNVAGAQKSLTRADLKLFAGERGAEFFGVAPLERLRDFAAVKALQQFYPNAKNVIVIGLHYPDAYLKECQGAPTGALGPYSFSQYQTHRELGFIAIDMSKRLAAAGRLGIPILDLCETESKTLNVRGTPPPETRLDRGMIGLLPFAFIPDHRNNRFAAVAAGLGTIGFNGSVLTPRHGPRQRFICVVTDLDLKADPVSDYDPGCDSCRKCISVCPTRAIDEKARQKVLIAGKSIDFPQIKTLQCDWAKRYGLSGAEGPRAMGSTTDIPVPGKITLEAITNAMEQRDPLQDHFNAIMEPCVKVCPAPIRKHKT